MIPGSETKLAAMVKRYESRRDIWDGSPLSVEICEELDREDEISRIRSNAATCSTDSILEDDSNI